MALTRKCCTPRARRCDESLWYATPERVDVIPKLRHEVHRSYLRDLVWQTKCLEAKLLLQQAKRAEAERPAPLQRPGMRSPNRFSRPEPERS